jgi:DNA-binding transcriptional ArsR family regulator
VFVWPKFNMIIDPPWQPLIAFTPPGVANLWQTSPPASNHALCLLLGHGRSEVLQCLVTPASTQDLAQRLQLAASSVSEHLSLLRQAGLVETHRRGRYVFYRLSPVGEGLLQLFAPATPHDHFADTADTADKQPPLAKREQWPGEF